MFALHFMHYDKTLFDISDCEVIAIIKENESNLGERTYETTRDEVCYVLYTIHGWCWVDEEGRERCNNYTYEDVSVFCPPSNIGDPAPSGNTNPDPTNENNTTSSGTKAGEDPCEDADCPEDEEENILTDFPEDGLSIDDDEPINSCERDLIIRHPIAAWKIKNNRDITKTKSKAIFGINTINECSDAFRHAYFNALNAKDIGIGLATEFGDAHECENDPEELGTEMDLFNNNIGYQIFSENPNLSDSQLVEKVLNAMADGRLKMFNDKGTDLITTENCL